MSVMKNLLKKNQVIIYIIALMLVTAGYLNYTTNTSEQVVAQTILENGISGDIQTADADVSISANGEDGEVSSNEIDENLNNSEDNQYSENTNDSNINENTTDSNTVLEGKETVQTTVTVGTEEYFAKSKLERDTMYSQMIESYENVLNSSNSLETQKQSATEEIKKINDIKNSIMICENLIGTKGFANNIIFVNGDSISVIVEGEELKQEKVAQIQNIISRELGAEIEDIHIATK